MICIHKSRGASAVMVLVVMVLMLAAFFAAYTLSRISGAGDAREDTKKRLAVATAALDRYVAANLRLPCPADPALAVGTEVTATAATCANPDGTLPWATLGLNNDAGLDGWGRKMSYRVYAGNNGSLTQPNGMSMVDCDIAEGSPAGPTATAASAGGLCRDTHDTLPAEFIAGKGLTLTDYGTTHPDVAYIVISHGATGFGAWTIAATQMDLPAGDERDNTRATGPFTIKAFSDPDTSATNAQHFDDQLVYATITDLAKRVGLYARNWPDPVAASVTFDKPTVAAALGQSNPSGDTGQTQIAFANVTVTALDSSNNAQNIAFQGTGPNQGLGGVSGGNDLQSGVGGPDEALRLDIGEDVRRFAIALDGFGFKTSPTWSEQVQLKFYEVVGTVATLQATIVKTGCNPDGNMATFENLDPGVTFNRVEIRPLPTTNDSVTFLQSSFLLAEIKACAAGVTCKTAAQTVSNLCS